MNRTRIAVIGASVLLATSAVTAGGGIAELHLDAAAVSEVLGAALPEPRRVDLPGFGEVTLRVGPVRDVLFREGAVEASVAVLVDEPALERSIRLRLLPTIDRLTGSAQLEVVEARVAGLPFELDGAVLIPPARLPRSVRWDLELPGARTLTVDCYVQGIAVEDDRLRLELGLVTSD